MLLRKRPDTVSVGRIKMYLQHENLLLFSRQYRLNVFGKQKVMARLDDSDLQAALVGYAAELEKINERIAAIQHQLNGRSSVRRLPLAVLGRSTAESVCANARMANEQTTATLSMDELQL